jgi:hypothetical protein
VLAQLVERNNGIVEANGSNPLHSIPFYFPNQIKRPKFSCYNNSVEFSSFAFLPLFKISSSAAKKNKSEDSSYTKGDLIASKKLEIYKKRPPPEGRGLFLHGLADLRSDN